MACVPSVGVIGMKKKTLFADHLKKLKRLGTDQRYYRTTLTSKLLTVKNIIRENALYKTNEKLIAERDDLQARVWVAEGTVFQKQNEKYLDDIQCQVVCQEQLAEDITDLKIAIAHMEGEVRRVTKQVYVLNRKIVPEALHIEFVKKARKQLTILENKLSVELAHECKHATINQKLRNEIVLEVQHRNYFNSTYSKLVCTLNSDRKYLLDLMEYTFNVFDNCIDKYDRIEALLKKARKDRQHFKKELQTIASHSNIFLMVKGKHREMADMQPRKIASVVNLRVKRTNKIIHYKKILQKIEDYTKSKNVYEVIKTFQEQESLYYSYFSFENELGYKMTLLNNAINRLYSDIQYHKNDDVNTYEDRIFKVVELELQLLQKQSSNKKLNASREQYDHLLHNILRDLNEVFNICKANRSPLNALLGNNSNINLRSVRRFCKLLELHLYNIAACVFMYEYENRTANSYYRLQTGIEKFCEHPTPLNDIVPTQECAECAESGTVHVDGAHDSIILPTTKAEAQKNLVELISQPEMQYRMHNLSSCRLQRSRALVAKRDM